MKNQTRRGLVITFLFFLCILSISKAKHHHKVKGYQCRTAWSSTEAQFHFNKTEASLATNKRHAQITGIPWQWDGMPIKSVSSSIKQTITFTPPTNTNNPSPFTASISGMPCMDSGVLLSCSQCKRTLKGKYCYKVDKDQLATIDSGEIECTKWYSRTGYAEGGGVTMCGSMSGDVYQCSSDDDMAECEPCIELGITSPS